MFLQTNQYNRRQFLERSALGFGGAFLLPSLLASCTDHRIPPDPHVPPIFPPIIPPLGDYDIDWNDDAKIVVVAGLEMIPEVGDILGPLVDIFWPSTKEDVWGEIKAQVEALINQKIDATVYTTVSGNLQGLQTVTFNYLNEIKNGTPATILEQWLITKNLFDLYLPNFRQTGSELLLLPLLAQFTNMYLSILRDGVLFGKSWGRTDGDVQQTATELTNHISDIQSYTTIWYNTGRANVVKGAPKNNHECEPFRTVNNYDRQMTLSVLNFMDSWYAYDATKYPNGTPVVLNREIYTDPYGTCDDSGNIVIASPVPTQRPTNLTVWAYDRIDAVQLTYPAGSGPGGVTTTPRMGDQSGGTNQPPRGGSFDISLDQPIIQARALYNVYQAPSGGAIGPVVTGMQFLIDNQKDGILTNILGNQNLNSVLTFNDTGLLGYLYQFVSSVHINGVNKSIGSADCVVFGFQYWTPPAAINNALRAIYVRSPKERSAADFAKALPKHNIPADLITENLKAVRKAYWESMKTRGK